jgi:hypothetical protein
MSFKTEYLQCALSKSFHFVQNSKQMSCGHSFCDGCLEKESAAGIKCEIRHKLNEICVAAEKEFEKAFETVKGKILILSFKNYS